MAERVLFGRTGLRVSPICFGTWQLSPRFWGPQPKEEILAAMRAALDCGINFFDTADAYGDGQAETVLGEFLSGIPRDAVVITGKVFNHFNPDGSRYPDLSPEHVAERCEATLRRLRTDYLDLYLAHFYDPLTPPDDLAEAMERLKAQGKIRFYGVSNHTVEQFRLMRAFGAFDVVEPSYSLLEPGIERDLLPYCLVENIAVMVYSPLHKGLLTGKYTGEESFEDFRRHLPDFQGERFRKICTAVRSLQPLAERYGRTIPQLILAATLQHPAIHAAIVGIKNSAQIREAAGAMGVRIERADVYAIRATLTVGEGGKIKDAQAKIK